MSQPPLTVNSSDEIFAIDETTRREHCAWCWTQRHPGQPYPQEWSSTLCFECRAKMQAQLAERQKAKQSTATAARNLPSQRIGSRNKTRRPRRRALPLSLHACAIEHARYSLTNIATCFREQAAMLPLQCSEAITRLCALRLSACYALQFLRELDPATTKQLKPYATIEKLAALDARLTEAILTIAMFAPICQDVCDARVELHLHIRSLFPAITACYEDTISQLTTLIAQASHQTAGREER